MKAFEVLFDTNDRVIVIAEDMKKAMIKAREKVASTYDGNCEIVEIVKIGDEPYNLVL